MSDPITLEQLEEIVRLRAQAKARPESVVAYGAYAEAVLKVEAALVEEAIARRPRVLGVDLAKPGTDLTAITLSTRVKVNGTWYEPGVYTDPVAVARLTPVFEKMTRTGNSLIWREAVFPQGSEGWNFCTMLERSGQSYEVGVGGDGEQWIFVARGAFRFSCEGKLLDVDGK